MVSVDVRDDEQLDVARFGWKRLDMRAQFAESAERAAIDEDVVRSTRFAVLDPDAVAVQGWKELDPKCARHTSALLGRAIDDTSPRRARQAAAQRCPTTATWEIDR
jgi:hypothetical protein